MYLVVFYQQLKDTIFGVNYQNILVIWNLLNYEEMFVGKPIYTKVCCDLYRNFYIYAWNLIILSYTNSFISSVYLWVLTSHYTLHVCCISLKRFKQFRLFWPSSFVDPLIKGTNNFWKVRGLIDGFNEFLRQIASGVERRQMSRWVPCDFLPPLKEIYRTTPIFLGIQIHQGHIWRICRALDWGQCFTQTCKGGRRLWRRHNFKNISELLLCEWRYYRCIIKGVANWHQMRPTLLIAGSVL